MVPAIGVLVGCGGGAIDIVGAAPPVTGPTGLPAASDSSGTGPGVPPVVTETPLLGPDFLALFDPSLVHAVSLEVAPEAWATVHDQWIEAAVTLDGVALAGAGVRIDGPDAEFGWTGKSDLELDLRRFGGERYADCDALLLDAQLADPAAAREVVATQLLRGAGVHAAWAAYADVTVNGVPAGLYTLREALDERYVRRRWPEADGTVWRSDDFADFTATGLEGFTVVDGPADGAALVTTRLAIEGETFWASVGEGIALDSFLLAWAVLDVLANDQGYPHAFGETGWYGDPSDGGRLVVLPGRQDQALQQGFALDAAMTALGAACLADPACDAARRAARVEVLEAWSGSDALAVLDAAYAVSAAAMAADPNRATSVDAVNTARSALHTGLEAWPLALAEQ